MSKLSHISIVAVFLSACGSDGPSFGPETDPTPAQQTAIMSTSEQLATLAMADAQGAAAGAAAISFAVNAQTLIELSSTARRAPGQPGAEASPLAALGGALRSAQLLECAVISADSIVWDHCTEQDGTTIDGMISWSPGHVEIDLHATATSGDVHATFSLVGSMTVSASAIQSDMTVTLSYSGNGINFNETIHTQVDIQLTNGCITSGTITVTASGSGTGSRSGAVQVVWSGCNAFRVRKG